MEMVEPRGSGLSGDLAGGKGDKELGVSTFRLGEGAHISFHLKGF